MFDVALEAYHRVAETLKVGGTIGDTYAIRDSGTECLNEFPPELIEIS